MSAIKNLAGQTAVYGLSSIVGRLLNYLLVPFYTRVFDQAEYGVVSEFYAYVAFLIIVYTYGMETAFFHFSQKEADRNKVYSTGMISVVLSSLFFSGALIFFSEPIANAIGYPGQSQYVTWFALILGFDAIAALPFARLRQLDKAGTFASIKMANILLNIGFNIFFLVVCPRLVNLESDGLSEWIEPWYSADIGVGYVFISNLVASVMTLFMLIPWLKGITLKPDLVLLRKMLIYAFPLLIAGFAGMINETLDRAIYKYLAPNADTALAELGVYSACYKLSIIMTLFIQTFRYAAEPFFFAQQKNLNKEKIYADVMKYFVMTCSIIFAAVMLNIDIIHHFIGEKFRGGLDVVPILLLANLCLGIFYNLSIWYKLTEQTRYGAYFALFGGVITIILLFILIPRQGYMGAAWTTLAAYGAMMILSYVTGQKHYPIPYPLLKMLISISLALLTWYASLKIDELLNPSTLTAFGIHTLLLVVLAGCLVALEKPKLKFQTNS